MAEDNETRKNELLEKIGEEIIALEQAQRAVDAGNERLNKLRAEYDGILAVEAREERVHNLFAAQKASLDLRAELGLD